MSRCTMTNEEARAIVNRALESHYDCDRRCDARAALEAGLPFCAIDYLDSAGVDDSGDLGQALERLDPGRVRRDSESVAFARLPYIVCVKCGATYYGKDPITCCGVGQRFASPWQAITVPHGRCDRAGYCVEHRYNRKVPACR